jgi:hypothetical protein
MIRFRSTVRYFLRLGFFGLLGGGLAVKSLPSASSKLRGRSVCSFSCGPVFRRANLGSFMEVLSS